MKNLKIGLVQQSCSGNRQENIDKSLQGIYQAADQGAELIILQELHCSTYFCQTEDVTLFDLAESIPGPATQKFSEAARQLSVVLVLSLFERRAAGLYHNTAVVLEKDGSIAGIYRKMHIPDDPGYYEKFYFTPGDIGFHPVDTSVGRLGVMVCWDQWYPEAARLMALAGADMLIYPTAIGYDPQDDEAEQQRQKEAWMTVQRGHAIANGIPVVAVNRVGYEADSSGNSSGIQFWGGSFFSGCQGELLAQAGSDTETTLCVELNLEKTEQTRRIWPFFRDRRIDHYDDLGKRFRN